MLMDVFNVIDYGVYSFLSDLGSECYFLLELLR